MLKKKIKYLSIMSEWENSNIIKSHFYDKVKPMNINFIDDMISYINNNININDNNKYNIIDIGCGNGRIIYDLKNKLNNKFLYTGIDCNLELINIAKEEFNNFSNVNFIHENVDNINLNFFNNYINYIFLFESTICMVKEPIRLLTKISKITNNIILNRTWITKDENKKIYDIPMKWDGMDNYSNNYRFSLKYSIIFLYK